MKARQNLRKRIRQAGLRGRYNVLRASYGAEWERLLERAGFPPRREKSREAIVRALASNSIYGKLAASSTYGKGERVPTTNHGPPED